MERRDSERIDLKLPVNCRVPAIPAKGVLRDVSEGGCHLEFSNASTTLGTTVLLDLPGAQRHPGNVVWTAGNHAGVRFARGLGTATAVALGLRAPHEEAAPDLLLTDPPASESFLSHWIRRLTRSLR